MHVAMHAMQEITISLGTGVHGDKVNNLRG